MSESIVTFALPDRQSVTLTPVVVMVPDTDVDVESIRDEARRLVNCASLQNQRQCQISPADRIEVCPCDPTMT